MIQETKVVCQTDNNQVHVQPTIKNGTDTQQEPIISTSAANIPKGNETTNRTTTINKTMTSSSSISSPTLDHPLAAKLSINQHEKTRLTTLKSSSNQMPKIINTPGGNIPLNSTSEISSPRPNLKPKKKISPQGQLQSQLQSELEIPPPKSSTPINGSTSSKSFAPSPISRSNSLQSTKSQIQNASNGNLKSEMQRTSSFPNASTINNSNLNPKQPIKIAPVPIQPNPNTTPSVQFHPIAIKPKPKSAQLLGGKIRAKSNTISRNATTPSITISKDMAKLANGTITLTTSKNWILPPRPKTKKVTKKKDKKAGKNGDINLSKSTNCSSLNIKKLPNSVISSAASSPSRVSTPLSRSNSTTNSTIISPTKITNSHLKNNYNNSRKDTDRVNKNNASTLVNNNSSNVTNRKMCAGCTTCVSPGIRSVCSDPSTGKVTINAQIHSNINLYTNNEKELEIQLQHVSRENDNLKKILLKLNKEIQNLKIAKEKDDNISTPKSKAITNKSIDIVKLESGVKSNNRKVSTSVNGNMRTSAPKSNHVKVKGEDVGALDINNQSVNIEPNHGIFIDDLRSSANTIDPMNLSYNLEAKRQKVLSLSPELISTVSPNLIQHQEASLTKQATNKAAKSAKSTTKSKSVKAKSTAKPTKKEFHSCGICEIGQKCICFETSQQQSLSMAATIAQALSRGGANLLGLGNNSNSVNTMNTINTMNIISNGKNGNGTVNTLTSILKREEIMKKLKDDDKKVLTNILKIESANMDKNSLEKIDIDLALDELSVVPLNDSISGYKPSTSSDPKTTDISNNFNSVNDDDDALLQMIDAELSLDPTPLVSPILLKKSGRSKTDLASSIMKKSESKESEHSLGNDLFSRGTLMDFNAFNGGDLMMGDEDEGMNIYNVVANNNNDNVPNVIAATATTINNDNENTNNTNAINSDTTVNRSSAGLNTAMSLLDDSAFVMPDVEIDKHMLGHLDGADDFMIY